VIRSAEVAELVRRAGQFGINARLGELSAAELLRRKHTVVHAMRAMNLGPVPGQWHGPRHRARALRRASAGRGRHRRRHARAAGDAFFEVGLAELAEVVGTEPEEWFGTNTLNPPGAFSVVRSTAQPVADAVTTTRSNSTTTTGSRRRGKPSGRRDPSPIEILRAACRWMPVPYLGDDPFAYLPMKARSGQAQGHTEKRKTA
jgi:hypothetical protein